MENSECSHLRNVGDPSDVSEWRNNSKYHYFLLIILLGAGLLRFWAIDWGSPHLLWSDELLIVKPAVRLWTENRLDPTIYLRPNHISIYLNALAFQVFSYISFHAPLGETFPQHEITFYVLSRILVAIFGTLSVLLAWLIGREYNRKFGLVVAGLFAVFPVYVEHSHYVNPDITLTFFILLVIYYSIVYLHKGSSSSIVLMAVFSGMATCEKYPGVLSLFLAFLVIIIVRWKHVVSIAQGIALSCIVFGTTMFVCAPFVIIHYKKSWQALVGEARPTQLGADGLGYGGNLLFYMMEFFSLTGLLMIIFLIGGSVLAIIREKTLAIPLFFGFAYMVILAGVPLHWVRWALPMYVSFLFLAAYGQISTWQWSSNYWWKQNKYWKKMMHVLIIIIVSLPIPGMLLCSISMVRVFSLPDTRVESLQFCEQRQISPENSIYKWYTPFTMLAMAGDAKFFMHVENALNMKDFTFDYIVLSSYNYGTYYAEKERYHNQVALYERVKKECILIKAFSPYERPNHNATKMIDFKPEYRWFPILRHIDNLINQPESGEHRPMQGPEILVYEIRGKNTDISEK